MNRKTYVFQDLQGGARFAPRASDAASKTPSFTLWLSHDFQSLKQCTSLTSDKGLKEPGRNKVTKFQ